MFQSECNSSGLMKGPCAENREALHRRALGLVAGATPGPDGEAPEPEEGQAGLS